MTIEGWGGGVEGTPVLGSSWPGEAEGGTYAGGNKRELSILQLHFNHCNKHLQLQVKAKC